MKLKDLVNKEFELNIPIGNIFDEDDIERVGEDYEVSDEQILNRIKNMIDNGDIVLKVVRNCDYRYKSI